MALSFRAAEIFRENFAGCKARTGIMNCPLTGRCPDLFWIARIVH